VRVSGGGDRRGHHALRIDGIWRPGADHDPCRSERLDRLNLAAVKVRDRTAPYIDLEAALLEESTRGAFVRAATAAAGDADAEEAQVLEDALRYGLMALSGSEVGLR
jgi:hypothetical protein